MAAAHAAWLPIYEAVTLLQTTRGRRPRERMAIMISLSTTTSAAPRRNGRATDWLAGRPSEVTYIECRTCAFEPADQFSLPRGRCPKCQSHTWQRSARPGMLLAEAAGRTAEATARGRPPRGEGDDGFMALAHRHGRTRG